MAESPAAETVKPLFSAEEIAARVDALARDSAAGDPIDQLIVAVLKGSFIFAADLIRALHWHGLTPEIDFIFLGSYGAGTTGGEVKILRDVESVIEGRDVVIVDDILDSGRTLHFAKGRLEERGAHAVKTCILLDKDVPRAVAVTPDFIGFDCPDKFVVGYGMDLGHRYRELPFIGIIENSA
jgi:hypoxanthine phosphoribosyltransferase